MKYLKVAVITASIYLVLFCIGAILHGCMEQAANTPSSTVTPRCGR